MIPDQYCWYHKGFLLGKKQRGGRRRREKKEKD